MEMFNSLYQTKPCVLILACILTAVPFVGSIIISLIVRKQAREFIKLLKLPKFQPPKCLEAIMWTLVYTTTGYASFLVVIAGRKDDVKIPLALYTIQLLLNWGFIPLFFVRRKLKCAFYEMILLVVVATACCVSFYNICTIAGSLFVPYIVWHIYMTAVTYAIYRDNYPLNVHKLFNENLPNPQLIINDQLK